MTPSEAHATATSMRVGAPGCGVRRVCSSCRSRPSQPGAPTPGVQRRRPDGWVRGVVGTRQRPRGSSQCAAPIAWASSRDRIHRQPTRLLRSRRTIDTSPRPGCCVEAFGSFHGRPVGIKSVFSAASLHRSSGDVAARVQSRSSAASRRETLTGSSLAHTMPVKRGRGNDRRRIDRHA